MRRPVTLALFLALAAGTAGAQTSLFRTVTVAPGKATRVATITALKGDCKVGPLSDVKVITAPKNGSLAVKSAKLKTPASFRCPNVETPVHGIFYQPNANFTGSEEISYEVQGPDGKPQRVNLRLEVGAAAPGKAPAAADKKPLEDI